MKTNTNSMLAPTNLNILSGRRHEQTPAQRTLRTMLGLGLAALALSMAAGCETSNSGSGDGGGGAAATGGTGGSGGTTATVVPGADLDGTWETACYMKANTTLTYTDLALVGNYNEYSDDACTTLIHVSKWEGTATVTGETAASDTRLDLAFTAFKSTALTDENAATNNMYQYCGMTDWAANVEKDILGKTCYGFSIPEGGKSLDIYRVDGATLKFGKGAKIATDVTEADRPTAIDDTRVFTKK